MTRPPMDSDGVILYMLNETMELAADLASAAMSPKVSLKSILKTLCRGNILPI